MWKCYRISSRSEGHYASVCIHVNEEKIKDFSIEYCKTVDSSITSLGLLLKEIAWYIFMNKSHELIGNFKPIYNRDSKKDKDLRIHSDVFEISDYKRVFLNPVFFEIEEKS